MRAGAPRHVPRGVRPALEALVGLRRYAAEMRRLLALEAERHAGPRLSAARSQGMDYAESRPYTAGDDARRESAMQLFALMGGYQAPSLVKYEALERLILSGE